MTAFSRRSFISVLTASFPGAILFAKGREAGIPLQDDHSAIPQTIAGHVLSEDEKKLVAKFSVSQEKYLSPLRTRDLPNGLPPTFVSPTSVDVIRDTRK